MSSTPTSGIVVAEVALMNEERWERVCYASLSVVRLGRCNVDATVGDLAKVLQTLGIATLGPLVWEGVGALPLIEPSNRWKEEGRWDEREGEWKGEDET
jgi:hypothetical protein